MDNFSQEPFIPAGEIAIGQCSICGGIVTVPTIWGCAIPATPKCLSCGATKKPDLPWYKNLPVISMERGQTQQTIITDKTNNIT